MNALIVDDDRTIRLFLRRVLEGRLNCHVTEAENGKKALDILQKSRPDFMLLDISMPELSGDELLVILRDTPAYKELPVVVLSAISDKEMIAKMLALGVSDYMLKPMEVQSTFDRIKFFIKKIEAKNNTIVELAASVPVIAGSLNLNISA